MSLREKLLNRQRPSVTYPLQVRDTAEAAKRVEEARGAVRLTQLRGDAQQVAKAKRELKQAEKALDDCHVEIVIRALPPAEFEELVKAHPPRKDTDDEAWNIETFPRACFLACVEGDMSEQDWDRFVEENCSQGERESLRLAALAVNTRIPDPSVPKG